MPVNSDEPRFIAAEVFADTLLEVGMGEDISQMARTAFYCLKMNKEENTEQKIQRIASKLSFSSNSRSIRDPALQSNRRTS